MEKYSRGRRGAPAKGVGRATGARVQIPPSPPHNNPNFDKKLGLLFFGFIQGFSAILFIKKSHFGGHPRWLFLCFWLFTNFKKGSYDLKRVHMGEKGFI